MLTSLSATILCVYLKTDDGRGPDPHRATLVPWVEHGMFHERPSWNGHIQVH